MGSKEVIDKNLSVPVRVTDQKDNDLILKELKIMQNRALLAAFDLCTKPYCVFRPVRIIKSDVATIVFWPDGNKTVVKRSPDEPDNEYTAFTAALAKRIFGSNNAIKKIIKTKTEVQKPKNDNN